MEYYDNIISVVRDWREDVNSDGWPTKREPTLDFIPLAAFDIVCDTLNKEWELKDSSMRVSYSMGEFRACKKRQRELF